MNKKERFCDVDNIVEWRHIITALLALVAMAGQTQTKNTAIVKGYSPALEDSTVVNIYIDNMSAASDTVFGGRFTLTVPVEKLTESRLFLMGKGCPNYLSTTSMPCCSLRCACNPRRITASLLKSVSLPLSVWVLRIPRRLPSSYIILSILSITTVLVSKTVPSVTVSSLNVR